MTQPADLEILQGAKQNVTSSAPAQKTENVVPYPTAFVQQDPSQRQWAPEFDRIIEQIADSCETNHPWALLRELIKYKIDANVKTDPNAIEGTLTAHGESINNYETRICMGLDDFEEPPFTLQRLCELAIRPTEHHKSVWKYLRAVEKCLLVTSYDDPPHIHVNNQERRELGEGGGWAREGAGGDGATSMTVDNASGNVPNGVVGGDVNGVTTAAGLVGGGVAAVMLGRVKSQEKAAEGGPVQEELNEATPMDTD